MSARLAAALEYAARSWPVVLLWWPLGLNHCACPKGRGCESPGKHPHGPAMPKGLRDATTEVDLIERCFRRHPELNVGLVTGVAFDVLDVDGPDAARWLACASVVHDAEGDWRDGPMSITAAGSHLLYTPTGAGNRTRMGGCPGVDWRGRGGYIVAPPSRHHTGVVYRWHEGNGADRMLEPPPAWLVQLAGGTSTSASMRSVELPSSNGWSAAGLIDAVAGAVEGERNDRLNWAAFRLGQDVRGGRVPNDAVEPTLIALIAAAERAGLGESEVAKTVRSGFDSGLAGRGRRLA